MPIMEATLHTAQLPKTYWDFAAGTACYLHNRIPHRITEGIPIEKITRTPAKLGHLVTFGSPAYVHIIKPQRRKLDEKAFKGIMVGYSNDSPGYMVYNPTTRRTVVTKHVRFDETFGGRLSPIKETPPGDIKDHGAAGAPPKMDEKTGAKSTPSIIIVETCPDKPPTKAAGAKDKRKEAARTEDNSDSDEDKSEKKIKHHNPLPA